MLAPVAIRADAFSAIPPERRDAVMGTFEHAPDGIKTIINRLAQEFTHEDVREYTNPNGEPEREACHYSPSSGVIRMEPNYDDVQYAEVFRHEYGHMVDHKCGNVARSPEFVRAIDGDLFRFAQDPALKYGMLDALAANSAMDDRCVSDILSGTFRNDPEIMERYDSEGASYWSHEDAYWDGTEGPQNARELEMFANLFSVYSAQDREESVCFLETYFPNTTDVFKSLFSM